MSAKRREGTGGDTSHGFGCETKCETYIYQSEARIEARQALRSSSDTRSVRSPGAHRAQTCSDTDIRSLAGYATPSRHHLPFGLTVRSRQVYLRSPSSRTPGWCPNVCAGVPVVVLPASPPVQLSAPVTAASGPGRLRCCLRYPYFPFAACLLRASGCPAVAGGALGPCGYWGAATPPLPPGRPRAVVPRSPALRALP